MCTKRRFHHFLSYLSLLFIILLAGACQEENYIPKPRGYPRVVLPERAYEPYDPTACPFTFEKPTYASIAQDTLFFNDTPENPCWMDIKMKDLNAQIHLSYKEIAEKEDLLKLLNDAYKLNSKHIKKADYIDDSLFVTPNKVFGVYYAVGGDAASSTQFVLTDSVRHFIWASLYFKERPNADSIAPVVQFIRKDIDHLINTFEWKE